MPGIGTVAAPPQPADMQASVPQDPAQAPDDTQGEDQPNVTPEEQAQYDQFVGNAMKLVYRDEGSTVKVNPPVLEHLKGKWDEVKPSLGEMPKEDQPLDPKNPIDNLAVATVGIVLALEGSAASQGKQVDPEVLFHGTAELVGQLADIAAAAGIHDFTTDEMTGVAHRTAMLYGVSSKTANKQEALAEFDHFLKTQGDQLGQGLGAIAEDQQAGGAQPPADGGPPPGAPPPDQQQQ